MVKGYTLLQRHERSEEIAAVLNAAGLDCRISGDITKDVWRKLIFNCVVNPVTTIVGCKVGGIVDPRLKRVKQLIVDECLAVARAEGVQLSEDLMSAINAAYTGSQNIVSMRQDLLRGRVSEIDYINGAIVALRARHGLECPVNDTLVRLIKGLETTFKDHRGGPRLPPPQELQTKTTDRPGVRAPETTPSEIIR